MSEQLVIRLGSEANQPIHWLVWSAAEKEIIASGQLPNAAALEELTQRAGGRPVIALVPSTDLVLRELAISGKVNRQFIQALPYMLEEELATDVDELHFAVVGKQSDKLSVAIVAHDKMAAWLAWLEAAALKCRQIIPDVLALPEHEGWTAVKLEQQWLIRQGEAEGFAAESELLPLLLPAAVAADEEHEQAEDAGAASPPIHCYSEPEFGVMANWQQEPLELPMKVLATGAIASKINLRQHRYQQEQEYSKLWQTWRSAVIACGLLFVALIGNSAYELHQLEGEKAALKKEINAVYRQVFPQDRRIRNVRSQMKNHLKALQGGDVDQVGFLSMFSQLNGAFAEVESLRPTTLRFDGKRQELRLQANAANFQSFEQFRQLLATEFDVQTGSLNQRDNQVQGTITIRSK